MANVTDFVNDVMPRERAELEKALLGDETVRWAVRPLPQLWCAESILLCTTCLPILIFEAVWIGGVMGFPESMEAAQASLADPSTWPFLLFSIPFLFMAAFFATYPWRRVRKLRRTLYVITNRRALVSEPGLFSWTMRPFALEPDMVLERRARAEGKGDLVFAIEYHRSSKGGTHTVRHGFKSLADLQLAERKLDEAIAARQGIAANEGAQETA